MPVPKRFQYIIHPDLAIARSGPRCADGQDQRYIHHVASVASSLAEILRGTALEGSAEPSGFLHDCGKCTLENYARLRGAPLPSPGHASQGSILAPDFSPLAYGVIGHHDSRLSPLAQAWADHSAARAKYGHLRDELIEFVAATSPASVMDAIRRPAHRPRGEDARFLASLCRFISAALRVADWRDARACRRGEAPEAWVPGDVSGRMAAGLDALVRDSEGKGGPLSSLQTSLRRRARAAVAYSDAKAFLAICPTGAGKSLIMMSMAQDLVRKHGLDGVLVLSPYRFLTQQFGVAAVAAYGADAVIEHQSASAHHTVDGQGRPVHMDPIETYLAYCVVTTCVQIFESFASDDPWKLLKLARCPRRAIVLDEPQAYPPHLVPIIAHYLDYCVEKLGCYLVMGTATDPGLWRQMRTRWEDAVSMTDEERECFRRVETVLHAATSLEGLADLAVREAAAHGGQAMVVVNSRAQALAVHRAIPDSIYLTTRLSNAQRKRALERVRDLLEEGKPCVLVATSLVECGIDLDFPVVLRALAPLPSLAQCGGRCDRRGKAAARGVRGRLHVVRLLEEAAWDRTHSAEFAVTLNILQTCQEQNADPLAPAALADYYRRTRPSSPSPRAREILEHELRGELDEVARKVRFIEDEGQTPVLVPIDALDAAAIRKSPESRTKEESRLVQGCIVALRGSETARALAAGWVEEVHNQLVWRPEIARVDAGAGIAEHFDVRRAQ